MQRDLKSATSPLEGGYCLPHKRLLGASSKQNLQCISEKPLLQSKTTFLGISAWLDCYHKDVDLISHSLIKYKWEIVSCFYKQCAGMSSSHLSDEKVFSFCLAYWEASALKYTQLPVESIAFYTKMSSYLCRGNKSAT